MEIVRINEKGSIIREESQNSAIIEVHKLTPGMMASFSSLLSLLGTRDNSRGSRQD